MTRSERNKRFARERQKCNPGNKCKKCGRKITGSHHYFCNDCYVPGLMYLEEIRRKTYG